MRNKSLLSHAFLLGGVLGIWNCQLQEKFRPQEEVIRWEAKELTPGLEQKNPTASWLQEEGFAGVDASGPARFLEIRPGGAIPEIRLLEFRRDYQAYAAFQQIANPEELAQGVARFADHIFFRKGKWLGMLSPTVRMTPGELEIKLNLPGGENQFATVPRIFESVLHQGRISHSERVLTKVFLGFTLSKPVVSVRLDCHEDSASLYVSPQMPVDFSDSLQQQFGFHREPKDHRILIRRDANQLDPLILEFSREGMIGLEGCSDTTLVQKWFSAQKTALKTLKIDVEP